MGRAQQADQGRPDQHELAFADPEAFDQQELESQQLTDQSRTILLRLRFSGVVHTTFGEQVSPLRQKFFITEDFRNREVHLVCVFELRYGRNSVTPELLNMISWNFLPLLIACAASFLVPLTTVAQRKPRIVMVTHG